jgi:arylsulfatase A-like enzyme
LLRGIDESGLAASTAVFFSSDHGDFAGDFNMIEKWPGGADDVLTRVPLFARIPGGAAGAVIRAPVSLFDVPHTICALAGLDMTGDGSGPHGITFGTDLSVQLRTGAQLDTARFVYSEGGFSSRNELFPMGSDHVPNDPKGMYYPRAMEEMSDDGNGSPKWAMRRNLTHKLVYRPRGESELYDFTTDPRELTNLYGTPAAAGLQGEMMAGLTEWLLQTSDVTPMHTDARGTPPYPHAASACATSGAVGPKDQSALGNHRDIPPGDLLAINGVEGFEEQ